MRTVAMLYMQWIHVPSHAVATVCRRSPTESEQTASLSASLPTHAPNPFLLHAGNLRLLPNSLFLSAKFRKELNIYILHYKIGFKIFEYELRPLQ